MSRLVVLFLFLSAGLFAEHYFTPLKEDSGPIDIVFTWVDDQDPLWQQAKQETYASCGITASSEAVKKNRFRNRDELKYSLRSIHLFADFVRNIYIVTHGHTPDWIKPHPKIKFIKHSKIFTDQNHLPTFNSQAIEVNLCRIPGLSERFIYLNDDMLFGNKVTPQDFFSKKGKIKVCFGSSDSPTGDLVSTESAFFSSWKNTNRFLDYLFVPESRKMLSHAPYALRKSHMLQFEKLFPSIPKAVSSHKFRSHNDYVMTCGLLQYFAKYQKQAVKADLTRHFISFDIDLVKNEVKLKRTLEARPQVFCIDDANDEESPEADAQLVAFFNEYFPDPAPWEYTEAAASKEDIKVRDI